MEKHNTEDIDEEEVDYDFDAQEEDIAGTGDDGRESGAEMALGIAHKNLTDTRGPVLLQGTCLRTSMGTCTMRKESVMKCRALTCLR